MKLYKKIIASIIFVLLTFPQKVFAEAYLEGDLPEENSSFLDGIDSQMLMANWYKIIIILVISLCVIGLVVSNIIWFRKNRNK